MNRFYATTMVGVVVTTVLALRVIGLRASQSAGPRLVARLRFDFEWFLRGAKSRIDDWIAANIARRERDAAISMRPDRSECEMTDMHLDCGCIDDCCSQQDCLARITESSKSG